MNGLAMTRKTEASRNIFQLFPYHAPISQRPTNDLYHRYLADPPQCKTSKVRFDIFDTQAYIYRQVSDFSNDSVDLS